MNSAMDNNYSRMKTWDDCVHRLFETKDFPDIVFVAEFDNESVPYPAHKLILATSSAMFAEMFYGPRAASTNHIILRNVEPKVVELMLRHIYFRKEVQFESLQQCFGVLSLATTYELSVLRRFCTSYIEGFIDMEHVCSVYQTAISVRNRNLALKSFQFMQKETSNILKQTSWKNALPVTVEAIVKHEYLNVDELELFKAVLDWAKWQLGFHGTVSNIKRLREEIEPFLPYFRFFNMNTETFLEIAATSQIFSNDEIASIALNFVKKNSCQLPTWFNRCTNYRSYEYQANVDDIYRDNWFNINKKVYSHSELVEKISSLFRAKCNDFSIHQLLIAICDDCFSHNRRKRSEIMVKVSIKVDAVVQETTIVLPVNSYVEYCQAPNFDKKEPIILTRFFSGNFISPKSVGMETHSPVVQAFVDPDSPKFTEVADVRSSTLSKVIDLEPPVLVQSEERFELSIEIINKTEPFFCCKKKPSFDGAPFSTHIVVGQNIEDEVPAVWCAFASVGYCVSKGEQVLHE